MFDVANLVADAMRDIERRDGPFLESGGLKFNASFILGGQIAGEDIRLFRLYAEGNFIEAGIDTNFLQTGEAKYGKPILDLAVPPSATMEDATKCVLVSFDSTMLSNLSVGMPIDLLCYARDSLKVVMRRRFNAGDAYFESLRQQWITGTRKVFHELPPLEW
jgi:putative proteasome-type protease